MKALVRIPVDLSPELAEQLDRYAKDRGESKRAIIERALKKELREPSSRVKKEE